MSHKAIVLGFTAATVLSTSSMTLNFHNSTILFRNSPYSIGVKNCLALCLSAYRFMAIL